MEIICKKCGSVDDYKTSQSGMHVRADCNQCGAYIKFLPQSYPEPIKLHFGKYAGQKIADITDRDYLQWAFDKLHDLNLKTKQALKNRLNQLTT